VQHRALLEAMAERPDEVFEARSESALRTYEAWVKVGWVAEAGPGFRITTEGIARTQVPIGRKPKGSLSPLMNELLERTGGRKSMASKLEVSEGTVGRWAECKCVPKKHERKALMALAETAGVPPEDLVDQLETMTRKRRQA
jgi:hypothetical protein